MFPVKDSRPFDSTILVFYTVVMFVLMHSCGAQSQVVGPSQPIVATVGEDVVLPCHLDPVLNAFAMTMEWARPDLIPRFVLVWRDGVELQSKKHPSYQGRTSVFVDELQHGNVSLKLSNVKISDEGTYRCFIPALDRSSTVRLVVGAASSPVIQEATNVSRQLQCESEGWYPEPELSWLDGEGNLLSAGPAETARGPDGLYTISSRVTVERKHGNNFTCRVRQKDVEQSREAHVHLPDRFFVVPGPPGSSDSPHLIAASVIVCAALVLLAVIFFVVWKRRRNIFKNQRRSCEDGAEEERTDSSHNSGRPIVMEHEGEGAPLMAGREEDNNVDNRGEEDIESQLEHQRTSVKDQRPERRRHVDEEKTETSVKDGREALSPTGGQTHQQTINPVRQDSEQNVHIHQEIKQKQETQKGDVNQKDANKKEAEQKETEPPSVCGDVTETAKLQIHQETTRKEEQKGKNQEVKKEEPVKDVEKKETIVKGKKPKKEGEQRRARKGGLGSTGKKKQEKQREERKDKAEGQKMENEMKLQAEVQRKERAEMEFKPQTGSRNKHLGDEKEKRDVSQKEETEEKRDERETEPPSVCGDVTETPNLQIHQETTRAEEEKGQNQEVKKEESIKDVEKKETIVKGKKPKKEGEQRRARKGGLGSTRKKKQEKQREEMKDEAEGQKMENKTKLQSDEQRQDEIKLQSGDVNQKDLDTNKKEAEQKKTEPPSVCGDVTETPNLQIHQETTRRKHQEEKQEETKEQPDGSFEVVTMKRHEDGLETDEGAHRRNHEVREETHRLYEEETTRDRAEDTFLPQRAAESQKAHQEDEIYEPLRSFEETRPEIQQLNIQETSREKPEESFRFLTGSQDVDMETDESENSELRLENHQLREHVKEGFREQGRAESQDVDMETDEPEVKFEEIRYQPTVRQSHVRENIREKAEESFRFLPQRAAESQEAHQEDTAAEHPGNIQETSREKPEESFRFLTGSQDMDMETDESENSESEETMDTTDTEKSPEEIRYQSTIQPSHVRENIREKPEESFRSLTESRGVDMETD